MNSNSFALTILNKYATLIDDRTIPSHVVNIPVHAKWLLDDCNKTKFWLDYCEYLWKEDEDNEDEDDDDNAMSIAEVSKTYMPVTSRGILKFTTNYTNVESFFIGLLDCYCDAIKELFNLHSEEDLICCVLLPSTSYFDDEEDVYVTHFRLQFPKIKIKCSDQNGVLRSEVLKLVRERQIINRLEEQPIGDWSSIISSDSVNDALPLYGSNEGTMDPLMLEHVYMSTDGILEEVDLKDVFVPYEHSEVVDGVIITNIFHDKDIEHWTPMFLSTEFCSKKTMIKESANTSKNEVNKNILFNSINPKESEMVTGERFLHMIDIKKRFQKKAMWLEIGQALYNMGNFFEPDEDFDEEKHRNWGFKLWKSATINSGVRNPEDCEFHKSDLISPYYTIRTLAWYAKIDNREMYDKWHNIWLRDALLESCHDMDETKIANAFGGRISLNSYMIQKVKDGMFLIVIS